jgi:hypothetical protein
MKTILFAALFALAPVGQLSQEARVLLQPLVTLGQKAEKRPHPRVTCAGLQAALDAGGEVELEPKAACEAVGYVIRRSGTTLKGNGGSLRGTSAPALRVLPGVNDVYVENLTGASTSQTVFQIGDNAAATQNTLELVPRRIVFSRVSVPTHRGKRGFEINGAAELRDCSVADTWSSALADSQGVAILNTPGPVLIDGGSYSAGSEIILVGGDIIKIPGVIPSNITIQRTHLWRPASWRTDGVSRVVKSNLQLKTGHLVHVRDTRMEGSWKDGQDGPGISITPRSGGAVTNALFERLIITNVGMGFHVTGRDSGAGVPLTPTRTTGIVVRDTSVTATKAASKTAAVTRGIYALVLNGVDTFDSQRVTFIGDGSQLVYVGDKERIGRIRFIDGFATSGVYSFQGPAGVNGTTWRGYADVMEVHGNHFANAAAALKKSFPANTFISRVELDALIAAR